MRIEIFSSVHGIRSEHFYYFKTQNFIIFLSSDIFNRKLLMQLLLNFFLRNLSDLCIVLYFYNIFVSHFTDVLTKRLFSLSFRDLIRKIKKRKKTKKEVKMFPSKEKYQRRTPQLLFSYYQWKKILNLAPRT